MMTHRCFATDHNLQAVSRYFAHDDGSVRREAILATPHLVRPSRLEAALNGKQSTISLELHFPLQSCEQTRSFLLTKKCLRFGGLTVCSFGILRTPPFVLDEKAVAFSGKMPRLKAV